MKSTKLFFIGLLVSFSASGLQAAAAEEEVKEQAEVKEAAAFDPEAESKTLQEFFAQMGLKFLGETAKKYTSIAWPPFEGESLIIGAEHGKQQGHFVSDDQRYMAIVFGDFDAQEKLLVVYDMRNRSEILKVAVSGVVYSVDFVTRNGRSSMLVFYKPFEDESEEPAEDSPEEDLDLKLYDLTNPKEDPVSLKVSDWDLSPDKNYIIYISKDAKNPVLYTFPALQEKFEFSAPGTTDVEFSPNGNYIALENDDEHSIEFYNIKNLVQGPKVLRGDSAVFMADGRSVAVISEEDEQTKFYSMPELVEQPGVLPSARVHFSSQGRYGAIVKEMEDESKEITLYEISNPNEPLKTFSLPKDDRWEFSPDERHFVIEHQKDGGEWEVQLYDIRALNSQPKIVDREIAGIFSEDGKFFANFRDDFTAIHIYELDNLSNVYAVVYRDALHGFSPDNKYLFASDGEGAGIEVWDLAKVHERLLQEAEAEEKRFTEEQEEKKRLEAERIAASKKELKEAKAAATPRKGGFSNWLQHLRPSSRWPNEVYQGALGRVQAAQDALDRAQAQEF